MILFNSFQVTLSDFVEITYCYSRNNFNPINYRKLHFDKIDKQKAGEGTQEKY